MSTIAILHPGKMGGTLAHSLIDSGHRLVWASEERSDETKARAEEYSIEDLETLDKVAAEADVVICIVNGGACLDIARKFASLNYSGIYCDANGLWGEESEHEVASILSDAGIKYVEMGLYGWPHPGRDGYTDEHTMYLSGEHASEVSELFTSAYWDKILTDVRDDMSAKTFKRLRNERERAENLAAGHPE